VFWQLDWPTSHVLACSSPGKATLSQLKQTRILYLCLPLVSMFFSFFKENRADFWQQQQNEEFSPS